MMDVSLNSNVMCVVEVYEVLVALRLDRWSAENIGGKVRCASRLRGVDILMITQR